MCTEAKLEVLGNGAAEVDHTLITPDVVAPQRGCRRRSTSPPGAPLLGFVGRFAADKGVVELAGAWASLAERFPDWHLLLVGEHDPADPVGEVVRSGLGSLASTTPAGSPMWWRTPRPWTCSSCRPTERASVSC